MNPAAAWEPCEFQLANWAVEEEPAADLPVEHADLAIFGPCSLPWPYAPAESGGHQLQVEHHYYSAASQRQDAIRGGGGEQSGGRPSDMHEWRGNFRNMLQKSPQGSSGNDGMIEEEEEDLHDGSIDFDKGCKQVEDAFIVEVDRMEKNMHRYPVAASLEGPDTTYYVVPSIVAIGPYHHRKEELRNCERVKHVAAIHCFRASSCSKEELYSEVASAADNARCLYHRDVMAGISLDEFRHMMFFDACFLVQFILMISSGEKRTIHPSLHRLLSPNRIEIQHDVMLLENQLPWDVVLAVMKRLRGVPYVPLMKDYIYMMKSYLHYKLDKDDHGNGRRVHVDWDTDYEPLHLLGLVRYYIVGTRNPSDKDTHAKKLPRQKTSVSAIELAKIGIKLTPYDTGYNPELIYMGLDLNGIVFGKLYLPPLCLSRDRASYLVNMAILEMFTVESFSKAPPEDSAVCSYLLLLATMVSRVEDVQELRARGLLHGGGGLTDEEALHFFKSLHSLRLGKCYSTIIKDIESYKEDRKVRRRLHAYYFNRKKAIALVGSGLVSLATIVGTLVSIKQAV